MKFSLTIETSDVRIVRILPVIASLLESDYESDAMSVNMVDAIYAWSEVVGTIASIGLPYLDILDLTDLTDDENERLIDLTVTMRDVAKDITRSAMTQLSKTDDLDDNA
jgi:hypothetical protein